jgi:hypothetical protein
LNENSSGKNELKMNELLIVLCLWIPTSASEWRLVAKNKILALIYFDLELKFTEEQVKEENKMKNDISMCISASKCHTCYFFS